MNKICILGLGYIGLPTATMFAMNGYQVVGVDINDNVISMLKNGQIHIHEPGLEEAVQTAICNGNLIFSNQPVEADAFIIAVPTPFFDGDVNHDYKRADLHYVISATEAIVPYLKKGNLVILESTSPPQTTINFVQPILEKSGLIGGQDFYLAYSPERVLPGQILKELVENARVIGGIDKASSEKGYELYASFVKGKIILTDATTAEMVKLMENTYRDVNIAIANEFSRLANRFEIDIWKAIEIANLHPRVNILHPGPGVGGHCISVDPWFLVEAAPDITPLIHTARQVNDEQPDYIVELVRQALGGDLRGKRIAALGLAYKPNVDDLRESPAVKICQNLATAGASVMGFEPFKPDMKFDSFSTAVNLEFALANAELVLLLVGHTQFSFLTPERISCLTDANIIIDTVGMLNTYPWKENGIRYSTLEVQQNDKNLVTSYS